MNLSTRIRQLADDKGVTMYAISQETGISQSTLSRFVTGKGNISRRSLKLLSDYFQVGLEWLITGEGEPYLDSTTERTKLGARTRIIQYVTSKGITIKEFAKSIKSAIEYWNDSENDYTIPIHAINKALKNLPELNPIWVFTGEGEMLKESEVITLQDTPEPGAIPYYSDLPVSAGERGLGGIPMHEKPSGWIKIPGVIAELGAFPVVGCSMEPNIHAGDFIAVSAVSNWDRVDPDKTYLIITLDERMIKHLMIDNEDTDILWCISPNYPKFKIYKAEIKFIYRITFHGKIM